MLTMDAIRQAVGADAAQDVAWSLVRERALVRMGRGKDLSPREFSDAMDRVDDTRDEPYVLCGRKSTTCLPPLTHNFDPAASTGRATWLHGVRTPLGSRSGSFATGDSCPSPTGSSLTRAGVDSGRCHRRMTR